MRKVRLSKVKCETLSWAVPSAWCMIVAHNNYQYRTALLRSVVRQQLTRMSIVDSYHPPVLVPTEEHYYFTSQRILAACLNVDIGVGV